MNALFQQRISIAKSNRCRLFIVINVAGEIVVIVVCIVVLAVVVMVIVAVVVLAEKSFHEKRFNLVVAFSGVWWGGYLWRRNVSNGKARIHHVVAFPGVKGVINCRRSIWKTNVITKLGGGIVECVLVAICCIKTNAFANVMINVGGWTHECVNVNAQNTGTSRSMNSER